MESTLPSQALTILDILVTVSSSVMLKLIPNGYTTALILHTLDTLDTLASTDTLLHTTTMSEPSPIPILVLIMDKWNDLPNGTNIIHNRKFLSFKFKYLKLGFFNYNCNQ